MIIKPNQIADELLISSERLINKTRSDFEDFIEESAGESLAFVEALEKTIQIWKSQISKKILQNLSQSNIEVLTYQKLTTRNNVNLNDLNKTIAHMINISCVEALKAVEGLEKLCPEVLLLIAQKIMKPHENIEKEVNKNTIFEDEEINEFYRILNQDLFLSLSI